MSDWRDRLNMSAAAIAEASAEEMAANRIMRSMGSSTRNIGSLCRHFGIAYDENESSFQRAVSIFREVYNDASLVFVFDIRTVERLDDIVDELCEDKRPSIIFVRIKTKDEPVRMTALVRDVQLTTSPLGAIVFRPGIRYLACKNDVQIWEQDPVKLLQSFKKEN